jgi:hypothetical protein
MLLRLCGATALALLGPLAVPSAGAETVILTRSAAAPIMLGRSVQGRPIAAVEAGDPDAKRRALIVGCIHGNERAGIAIATRLTRAAPPPELDLSVIPSSTPTAWPPARAARCRIAAADETPYAAKRDGRNRVVARI